VKHPQRLDAQPLRDWLAQFDLTAADLARRANAQDETVRQLVRADSIPWWWADRFAVALGVTPHQVWGARAWEGPPREERAEAAFAALREAVAA
jgi:hypothetical protein